MQKQRGNTGLSGFTAGLGAAVELRLPQAEHPIARLYPKSSAKTAMRMPDLQSAALAVKRAGQDGQKLLILGGGAGHGDLWPKLALVARRSGFEQIWLMVSQSDLDVGNGPAGTPLDLPLAARLLSGLIVVQNEGNQPTTDAAPLPLAWLSLRILTEANAASLEAAIRADLDSGAGGVLLGYPFAATGPAGGEPVPRTNELRRELIATKYRAYRERWPVALFGLPACAWSYGEPLRIPALPLPDVVDFTTETPWPPQPAWRRYAPQGVLPCACMLRGDCTVLPQAYAAHHPEPQVIGVDYLQAGDGDEADIIIRPTLRCNQDCGFCFTRHNAPDAELEELKQRLIDANPGHVVISGGEPGLYRDLVPLIRFLKDERHCYVTLQTNATLYADKARAQTLIATGLNRAFISLHSHLPEISDGLTRLSGSFARTLQGIENLAQLPGGVSINHVITRQTYPQLMDFVRFLDKRFPMRSNRRYALNLAFVGIMGSDKQPDLEAFVPRLSDVAPHLQAACRFLAEAQITNVGLDTPCGVPRCMLNFDPQLYPKPQPSKDDDFAHGPQCARCSYLPHCFGVRANYAALYGTDELVPDTDS